MTSKPREMKPIIRPDYPSFTLALKLKIRADDHPFMSGDKLYAHLIGALVWFDHRADKWESIRDYHHTGESDYCDFRLTAQSDTGIVADDQRGSAWYGLDYGRASDSGSAIGCDDLDTLSAMVSTLRRVKRGMEKMDSEIGCAESISQWIIRIARILRARIIVENDAERADRSGVKYRHLDPSGVRYWVHDFETSFRDRATSGAA